jgi:long-chain fatty acid transport protein
MKLNGALKLFVAAGTGGFSFTLFANGLRLVSQDGFASARGEAFVATADNPSAIYYNPAGITQLQGGNVRGGIYGIYFDPSYRPPANALNAGNRYHIKNEYAAAPSFFYAYTPGMCPLSFGCGIYAPYGGSVSWPQDTGFRAVALSSSLQYVTLNPVAALKLSPTLSIGAGAMVNYGNLKLEQGLRRFKNAALPDDFRFAGEGWCAGYNLGLLWKPHEQIALGATFRSTTTMTFSGHTEFERLVQIPETRLGAQADFHFPLTAVFGISYRPTPEWNLEFDADYTDWNSFGTTTIHQAAPTSGWPSYLNQWPRNIPVNLNWQPSWMYEFGVTRYSDNGWHASAGYVFNENSVPDRYYLPTTADLNRHFFSIGVGHKGKRFDFDIAYQFGYGPERKVSGSVPPSQPVPTVDGLADGTYEFTSHAVLLTVGMHF